MSSASTPSALNAETQTRPVLTDLEVGRARPYGRVRQAELGDILLSATVQIVQPGIDGERLITTHCPGTFTGEAGMIAGQRALVLARSERRWRWLARLRLALITTSQPPSRWTASWVAASILLPPTLNLRCANAKRLLW